MRLHTPSFNYEPRDLLVMAALRAAMIDEEKGVFAFVPGDEVHAFFGAWVPKGGKPVEFGLVRRAYYEVGAAEDIARHLQKALLLSDMTTPPVISERLLYCPT